MEDLGGPRFHGLGTTIRKRRTQTSRRPRPEIQLFYESNDPSPLSSVPVSDDLGKVSSDENNGDANSKGKTLNLNHCMSRGLSATRGEGDHPQKKIKEDGGSIVSHNNGLVGDSVDQGRGIPSGNLGTVGDGVGTENKPKRVKLKVGGVTRTIQTKLNSNGSSSGHFTKSSRSSDAPRSRQRLILQDNSDEDHSPSSDKKSGLQGIPWEGCSRGSFGVAKEDMGKLSAKNGFEKQAQKSDPVRKSKRVPKRRVLEGAFDEDDEDDEIRYLEKLKISKAAGYKDFKEESAKKQRSLSKVSKGGRYEDLDEGGGRSGKDGKKSRSERNSGDTDYDEDEELLSDCEPEGKKKKKQRKDSSDSHTENKREMTLTTRQRALLYGKDVSSISGASQIEFPNGLPPPPPRKQKEKLTEMEQQLKKAEAAQRRRIQNEKAARESEAEAIRKILGQDSSRKKREEKIKKRQEELAQEKAASAHMLASNTIRWVMGPSGTVVTFPQDMGLPKLFDPKPSCYPPQREKCAAPSCSNPYKYRDSKSKLPLCSLQCYKAIHAKMEMQTAC